MTTKQALTTVATMAVVVLTFGLTGAVRSPAQVSGGATTAEKAFKNVQVLRDIPADELIPSMQFITASLGVECEFCHIEGAFDKDDKKPKQTARKMMQMMFAINRDNFEGHREVTCYSCHRGAPNPVGTPVIASGHETNASRDMTNADEDTSKTSADPILEKYVAALGGADAIRKITSRVEKGMATVGGHDIPIDVYAKAPDKRAAVMHTPKGDSITAYDGHRGWLINPGRPLREMNSPDTEAAALDADFYLPVRLKEIFGQVRVRPTEKVEDRDVTLVEGIAEGKPPVKLYFDQQSGLLVRMVRYAETPLGQYPTQIDYGDYREQGGVKTPFRWTIARPGVRFTIQVQQLQQNVPIDDARFTPPPPPPMEEPPSSN